MSTRTHTSAGTYQRMLAEAHGIPMNRVGRVFNTAPVVDPTTDPAKVEIPTTVDAFEQMLGDDATMKLLLKDGEQFSNFISQYARTVHNQDLSIKTQVTEQVQATLAEWLQTEGADIPEKVDLAGLANNLMHAPQDTHARKQGLYNPKAMGAQLDKEFANSAEFFQTIWHNTEQTASVQAKRSRLRNAFSSGTPSEGGFLIPEVLRSELLRVALESAIVRPRARVIPMDSLRVPFPAVDSTTNVGSVYGGIVTYWKEEGAALTETSGAFSRIVLDAKKLTAYTEVPNELMADSVISFQTYIDDIFPEAMAHAEDLAFFSGTGVGEPLGFLNAASAVSVTQEAGQAAASIVWENIVKMYARMLPGSLNRAVWIASIDTFPQLATMSLDVGTGGSAIWLNNGAAGPPMTILGRPVIFTEKANVLGTSGDLNFVDLGFYLVGDRQAMSASSSSHYKFQNDVTAYRIIERVDGLPWLQSAITPANGSAALSPFVKLEARAGS